MSLEDIKRKRNEDAATRDKAIDAAKKEIKDRNLKKMQTKKQDTKKAAPKAAAQKAPQAK
jgi:hypothetical protein